MALLFVRQVSYLLNKYGQRNGGQKKERARFSSALPNYYHRKGSLPTGIFEVVNESRSYLAIN
jgi:hypothetical protein